VADVCIQMDRMAEFNGTSKLNPVFWYILGHMGGSTVTINNMSIQHELHTLLQKYNITYSIKAQIQCYEIPISL